MRRKNAVAPLNFNWMAQFSFPHAQGPVKEEVLERLENSKPPVPKGNHNAEFTVPMVAYCWWWPHTARERGTNEDRLIIEANGKIIDSPHYRTARRDGGVNVMVW